MNPDVEKIRELNIRKVESISDDYWKKFTSSEKQLKRIAMMLDYEYGESVLEIGPGRGYLSIAICKTKENIVEYDAIEIDPMYTEQCREMARLNEVSKINCHQGDGCKLIGFHRNYYDTIVMAEVLERVHTPLRMLKAAYATLSISGSVIITVPRKGLMPPAKTPDHVQDFSVDDMKKLISRAGFKLLHHTGCHSWEFYLAVKQNYNNLYNFLYKYNKDLQV